MKNTTKAPIKITITPSEITISDPLAAVTSHTIRNDGAHSYDATAANVCESAKLLGKLDGREIVIDDQRPAAPVATPAKKTTRRKVSKK